MMVNPIIYLTLIALLTLSACGGSNNSEAPSQDAVPAVVEALPVVVTTPTPVAETTPTPAPTDEDLVKTKCAVYFDYQKIWDSGYVVEVHLINQLNDLKEWEVSFLVPRHASVQNIWNAEVIKKSRRKFVVKNLSHNAEVSQGKEINFWIEMSREKRRAVLNAEKFYLNGQNCRRAIRR